MKKIFLVLTLLFSFMLISKPCLALSFSNASAQYSAAARTRARFVPRGYYANRYMRQQNNYIYSPQQARYYGYRTPQQNYMYGNPYYNRCRR